MSPLDSTPAHDDAQDLAAQQPQVDQLDQQASPIPVVPAHVTKEIFASALRSTLIMLVALTVLGVGVGALVAGAAGVWAALLGVGVTLIFSGTTIASMLYTADKGPNTTMAVLLGGWIAKMALLIVILAVLGQLDFYHRLVFAVIVLVGVIGSAALDMRSVIRGREPYVNPAATVQDVVR